MKINAPNIVNKHGIVGESALWDGPLDLEGFPMGKGSSSGKNGMEVSKAHCGCTMIKEPITNRAMGRGKMVR
jgi:hypothetical protein